MKIGTLRDIADLNDEDFALVLQALPAIRKEIRAFTEKMTRRLERMIVIFSRMTSSRTVRKKRKENSLAGLCVL